MICSESSETQVMNMKKPAHIGAALLILLLSACQQDPDTPMKLVMSDQMMDRYSANAYQEMYEENRPEYDAILAYCKAHDKKPNCIYVFVANQRIFRYQKS